MRQETLILIFIRAHREKNFPLYMEALEELTPLIFVLNRELPEMDACSHQRHEVFGRSNQG